MVEDGTQWPAAGDKAMWPGTYFLVEQDRHWPAAGDKAMWPGTYFLSSKIDIGPRPVTKLRAEGEPSRHGGAGEHVKTHLFSHMPGCYRPSSTSVCDRLQAGCAPRCAGPCFFLSAKIDIGLRPVTSRLAAVTARLRLAAVYGVNGVATISITIRVFIIPTTANATPTATAAASTTAYHHYYRGTDNCHCPPMDHPPPVRRTSPRC